MKARFEWSAGRILFLYFCGVLLGSNVMLLAQALVMGAPVAGTLVVFLVSLVLPVLPVAAAYGQGRRVTPSRQHSA